MNVLLAGGECALLEALASRYAKEGDRVFWLTGTRDRPTGRVRAFARYSFPLDGDAVREVVRDVGPDLVVCLGAYDPTLDWAEAGHAGRRFLAGVTNLMLATSDLERCRMVYLSSEEPFAAGYDEDVKEDARPSPLAGEVGWRAQVLTTAESQWLSARQLRGSDVLVLRLDHVFSLPSSVRLRSETCLDLCLTAFRSGRVYADASHVFSPIYVDDAVDAVWRASKAPAHAHDLYNVASGQVVSEREVAELVRDAMGGALDVVVGGDAPRRRVVLDGSRFADEFGMGVHHRVEDAIPQIVSYLRVHGERFLRAGDTPPRSPARALHALRTVGGGVVPVAENLACAAIVTALMVALGQADALDLIDPYLLYVLLFAITYGQGQAILAGCLATAGHLWLAVAGHGAYAVAINVSTYLWVAQLFVVGLSVGYLKDRLDKSRTEADDEIAYLRARRDDIKAINAENARVKQMLESQLLDQSDSLGRVYRIASELYEGDEREVIFRAAHMLSRLTNSPDVSIYLASKGGYLRLVSTTSDGARQLGNSVRVDALGALGDDLAAQRTFVNRALEARRPGMARGIYGDDGELKAVAMIWQVPWERMTLAQADMLAISCMLIRDAMVRAARMIDALTSSRTVAGTGLLDARAFAELRDIYRRASEDGLVVYGVLRVAVPAGTGLPAMEAALRSHLRETDYLGVDGSGAVLALLTNAPRDDARRVQRRLAEAGFACEVLADEGAGDYGR
ncbi:NAD(P)-dependent oxidoreductase [bacterium]|nr:NAD(P)-dependent oxidoreductase [bacterium]